MVKNRIEQLRALTMFEWWLMLIVMLLLPVIALSLRIVEYNKTKNLLGHLISEISGQKDPDPHEIEKARTIARMVAVAAGHGPYIANCLKQSIVLWWMLARHGISSEIIFGATKEKKDSFGAHAWVECCGINISDTEGVQQRFLAFEN
jgi:transglutaminase superfamily protein